jgi:hypothetical protein
MAAPAARDFEPARISPGETIAAASGILLFIFLFFHWFTGVSAWQFFDVVDVLLAVIAILAVAVAGAKAMGNDLFGENAGLFLGFIGTIASSITLTFVLEANHRAVGLWLSLFASLGVLYGGWRRMHEPPGTPGPLAGGGLGGGARTTGGEPTTPMSAADAGSPGVPGGGAAGVSPGKEGPGVPHPGTSTGAPGDDDDAPARPAAGDPVPGQTGAQSPPGIAGEPPAGGGTQAPGL